MNALFGLLAWFLGIFNPTEVPASRASSNIIPVISQEDAQDVHIINVNPRTVVALEDTHFRPSR